MKVVKRLSDERLQEELAAANERSVEAEKRAQKAHDWWRTLFAELQLREESEKVKVVRNR